MFKLARLFSTKKSITVYEAPYYNALVSSEADFIKNAIGVMNEKYHGFVPFYLESRLTGIKKRFVVKMELVPEETKLKITSLQLGSLDHQEVPIENIVPVTAEDYEISHVLGKQLKSPEFFDTDMVYLNKPNTEFYVFDKEGMWVDEGVNHPMLSFESNYNEHKWYDTSCGPRRDINGGNSYPNA